MALVRGRWVRWQGVGAGDGRGDEGLVVVWSVGSARLVYVAGALEDVVGAWPISPLLEPAGDGPVVFEGVVEVRPHPRFHQPVMDPFLGVYHWAQSRLSSRSRSSKSFLSKAAFLRRYTSASTPTSSRSLSSTLMRARRANRPSSQSRWPSREEASQWLARALRGLLCTIPSRRKIPYTVGSPWGLIA